MNSLLLQAASIRSLLAEASEIETADERVVSALDLAQRLRVIGEWGAARDLTASIAQVTTRVEHLVSCGIVLAECQLETGEYAGAAERLEQLAVSLSAMDASNRSIVGPRLRTKLAYAWIRLNRLDEAEPCLQSAYAELVARPDSADLGWCALNIGNLALWRGDLRAATARFAEAVVSADRTGCQELRGVAFRNLSLIHRHQCRWELALEAGREAAAVWKAVGHRANHHHAEHAAAIVCWKRGRISEAIQLSNSYLQFATDSGIVDLEIWALQLRALARCHGGDFPRASVDLETASRQNRMPGYTRPSILLGEFLGDVHLEQGQAADALKHYDEVWPKAMALVPKGDIVAELRRRRAECYLLLGRHDEAYSAATEALAHCRELGDRYEEAATYRVLALSAAAVGKPDEARQHFIQGFAYYEDIETPYEWGKLWMAYGDWLSGPNAGTHADRANAREAYRAARDHFSNMGAQAKLREAEARLVAIEPPPVEGTVGHVATNGLGLFGDDPAAKQTLAQGSASIIRRAPRRPTSKSALDLRSDAAWTDWYLITRYEPLLNMLDRATRLAKSEVSILITGETGTGKELIAAGMHRFSGLAGPYVPLNCAAVPKEMIESELFGHVRGAFSGAVVERAGLVEMAAKGTLFLDEVGEMSEAMQAKLLRFLESGEYRRVGESANRHVKTRLIAATNISRDDLSKGEGFRGDLYWRLGQSFLDVPPLRHRKGDVPLLLEHFLRLEASKMGKPIASISEEAMRQLETYAWPGNIRELIGVMRRAVALADRSIEPEHLDLSPRGDVAVTLTEEMAAAERVKLARAMKEHNNSPTLAAKALGIPRTTLVMKLKRYGMR